MFTSRIARSLAAIICVSGLGLSAGAQSGSGPNLPPFDFSNAFYLANGIDPTTLIGRPNGTGPNSVIDNTPNGADLNNVRILQQAAAFDHSGHPIFFVVTGLPTPASFTNNAAGQKAFQIAEQFKVYEFPRATNPTFSVFPKRQDLIADLRNGYFSNNPLGVWQINLVRYTPAAFNTQAGQQALAELAADNGIDLDGTPLVRTISEIENLQSGGFVTIATPPVGGPDFRWFFCPVIEDPRNGAIAPDAHLDIIRLADGSPLPSERENFDLFHCLQATGDECGSGGFDGFISAFGFGSAATCPCGNASGGSTGCTNSTGQGGRLSASGQASVPGDTVVLAGSGMPNSMVLYFQGSAAVSTPFGDGLRVAGGQIKRLGLRQNAGGASTFPSSATVDLSDVGQVQAGDTRYYQAWYRDSASFCTAENFNLTNGVRIIWAP